MCGIVAYTGIKQCKNILLNGLKRLEYRGYDSAGVGILSVNHSSKIKNPVFEIKVAKEAGKIKVLEELLKDIEMQGVCGIGHTRWATHGEPTQINAHPHFDCKQKIAVVHNGIIENYAEIREELIKKGHIFISQTDTEVLPHLLEGYLKSETNGSLLVAMQKLMKKIRGSGAIVAISVEKPNEIIAGRIASPLIVGTSRDGNFLASDMPAVLDHTRLFTVINDYETVCVTRDKVKIYDSNGKLVQRNPFKVNWSIESAEKGGYEDFMLKEIFEQPYGIKETMRGRLLDGELNFEELNLTDEQIKNLKKIQIIACGTSYHAALTGKLVIEKWAKIPVE
ncbi:MAG: isomerizing glutamine--fructose-6-phosphate transaminase, partial [Actinobacteria bacterium]|nr:isomerizing glutamine--fructose-6-phosphate transaminase [Actinomycetota bacterium]